MLLAIVFAIASAAASVAAHADPAAPADGLRLTPSIQWRSGEHRIDLGASLRVRTEVWDAHGDESDVSTGTRTRVRAAYSYGEALRFFAELQDVRLHGLDTDASGADGLYRANSGADSNAHGTDLRQVFLEVRPHEDVTARFGRQDLKLGTEVLYPEADWRYLKLARASQRLVGTVGWSHAERSNDGLSVGWKLDGQHLFAFAARPTTGVFDIDSAYRDQSDIVYGGLSWTLERGAWLDDTEVRVFALTYHDDRPVRHGGLPGKVEVHTLGLSALGIHPIGPGKADLLLWVAGQLGDYDRLDHRAIAGILEVGYQLPDGPGKPWLRLGVNAASGDDEPGDGDHETFFNMLPTNHLYYGFADRLAFQNLIDSFIQLRLAPHPRVDIDLFLHHFTLATGDDARYFGTGAFNKSVFGFGSQPSRGLSHVGNELDAVVNVRLAKGVDLQGGYSYLNGGALLSTLGNDPDVHFGYVQLRAAY